MAPANKIAANRRSRERALTRQRIIAAARKLFIAEGYERVTMRRIADEVEYTPGAIYSYFPDKDSILYALHSEGFLELGRYMQASVHGQPSPMAALYALGRAYLQFAKDLPDMYDLMFVAQGPGSQMVEKWPEGTAVFEQLVGVVTAAMDGGWLRPADPYAVSFGLWSMCHGMATLDYRERCAVLPEAKRDTAMPEGFDYIVQGLALRPFALADGKPAKRATKAPVREHPARRHPAKR